jgi:hypothetical protein
MAGNTAAEGRSTQIRQPRIRLMDCLRVYASIFHYSHFHISKFPYFYISIIPCFHVCLSWWQGGQPQYMKTFVMTSVQRTQGRSHVDIPYFYISVFLYFCISVFPYSHISVFLYCCIPVFLYSISWWSSISTLDEMSTCVMASVQRAVQMYWLHVHILVYPYFHISIFPYFSGCVWFIDVPGPSFQSKVRIGHPLNFHISIILYFPYFSRIWSDCCVLEGNRWIRCPWCLSTRSVKLPDFHLSIS